MLSSYFYRNWYVDLSVWCSSLKYECISIPMCPILQLDCQMCNSWMCTEEATCICIKVCTWIWRESWLWMEIWHWTETWLEHLDCEQECWVTSTNWYLQKRFEQCWGHLDWRPWKGGATLWVHDFSTKCYCSTLQILCAQTFYFPFNSWDPILYTSVQWTCYTIVKCIHFNNIYRFWMNTRLM